MKSADGKDMYDSGQLIAHLCFRIQFLFVSKRYGTKNRCIFSCSFLQDLSAAFFYLQKELPVAGIHCCFLLEHSVLHKIINMTIRIMGCPSSMKTTGIKVLAVKAPRIRRTFHSFQRSLDQDPHSRFQIFFFFEKYSYIFNWKFF